MSLVALAAAAAPAWEVVAVQRRSVDARWSVTFATAKGYDATGFSGS